MIYNRINRLLSQLTVVVGIVAIAINARVEAKEEPKKTEPESDAKSVKTDPAAEKAEKEDEARKQLPVAKVNGMVITVGDMEEAMAGQSPMFRQEFANPEKKKELLDRLVKTQLMAEEAKKRGYNKDPEVLSIAKNKLASLMHRQLMKSAESVVPSDEDLKKYYDENIDDYHKPEKMRARHILIKDKEAAEALLKDVLKKKPELHEFRKIAKDNTEDEETKKKGGDLGFFPKTEEKSESDPDVPAPIVEAVFKLSKNGDVSPKLVETEQGYHIVMRTGHRKKMDVSFEEAKDRLAVLVKREMRRDTIESDIEKLKERYPTTISEENLKHVVIDLSGNAKQR
jgi:peptidyl-prolyl cis-trans isomerase C